MLDPKIVMDLSPEFTINGECPMCDAYEARFVELFDHYGQMRTTSPSLLVIPISSTD
jgi:hypothetical protein